MEKAAQVLPVRPLSALAAIYSRGTCRPTTIDVLMFHFRVRNGTGWGHQAVTTRFRLVARLARRRVPGCLLQGWLIECAQFPWGGEDWHPQGIYYVLCTMYYVLCTILC